MKGFGKPSTYFLFFALLFPGITSVLQADTLRGKLLQISEIENGIVSGNFQNLKLEDLGGITLGEDLDLVSGIELAVEIPPDLLSYSGTVALYIYRNVSPELKREVESYKGELLHFKPFLQERKVFIHIPLFSRAGFLPAPDTVDLDRPLDRSSFPLVFTFLPIMKGIPDPVWRAEFKARVRPLFKDLGKIRFTIKGPSGPLPLDQLRVYMNDELVSLKEPTLTVKPGIKNFRIETEGFPPFLTTAAVERGKEITIDATFIKKEAALRINAPAGTSIYIDGNLMTYKSPEITIEAGEHTFTFRLGDYQISKRFYLEQGKSYSISLYLDILINEH
ncbi:MAG: hypothetical protein SNJ78_07600 [Spirochaetales bacterium]